jgi:hypothetical protein
MSPFVFLQAECPPVYEAAVRAEAFALRDSRAPYSHPAPEDRGSMIPDAQAADANRFRS